jgi:DNA-directed RNA polymerase subunit RPC12/RpoP
MQSLNNKSQVRKNFISINEGFICINCGKYCPPHKNSYRNHCKYCLYSKHVDNEIPGDRKSKCNGLMEPIKIDYSGKKGYIIVHKCIKCGKTIRNKTANDDNLNEIIKLSTKQYI